MTKQQKLRYHSRQLVQPEAPKTPEQKLADIWETIEYQTKTEQKFGQESVDKFSARLSENPFNAFEWSADAFTGAARVHAAKEVQAYIAHFSKGDDYVSPSKLEVLKKVREEIYSEVLRGSKWPERSSSPSHNLMHVELNAKRAEWLERFDHAIRHVTFTPAK